MFKINPYRPGAGVRPQYLAGRDEDIENVTNMFTALTLNIPTQSVIFSGLRGVGKTVLINRLQEIAEEKNIFCKHIEVAERNDFISQIATCSQAFLRQISVKEKFKNLIKKPLDADVENNLEEFFEKLDTGFFKLRYERCSAAEKKFIFAMVKCGELPCTIANIAEIMKKSINSISTARAQLINKGIIYPVKYRELDFTVPQFSGFIYRLEEYKQWDAM